MGYQPSELIGTSVFQIIHPDNRQKANTILLFMTNSPGRQNERKLFYLNYSRIKNYSGLENSEKHS